MLLQKLTRAANPDEALVALDGFLAGLPAGVQIFSLFEANPTLVDLIIDIAATAPALARHLARNAAVLDAVIGGSFFARLAGAGGADGRPWRSGWRGWTTMKRRSMRRGVWMKEWHFRVGVHHLRGLIDGFEAGKQYAELAEAVVAALWPVVVARVSPRKHGPLPGRGAVVLGMGSLGAGRLNAGSDLDLIVIYDAAGVEASSGPRPLAARPYYARLTQAMVTALTAQMPEGRLYEVDMRLRPSGRQGPVATSLESFRDLSDDRGLDLGASGADPRPGAGGRAALGDEVEALRREILRDKGQGPQVARRCGRHARPAGRGQTGRGGWEAKLGPGKMMDIELAGADDGAARRQARRAAVERQIGGGGNGGPCVANGRDGASGRLQAVLALAGGVAAFDRSGGGPAGAGRQRAGLLAARDGRGGGRRP